MESQAEDGSLFVNATAASLLGLLDASGGELTGGELVRRAQQQLGDFWTLTRSQVHRELATLEEQGLVEPGAPGPRDARPYRVSGTGRQAYRRWLVEDLPGDTIRIPLLLAVAFARALPPDRLAGVLDRSRREHEQRLAGYRALDAELAAGGVDAWSRATLAYGIAYEEAVLGWFDRLPPVPPALSAPAPPPPAPSRGGARRG